MRSKIILVLLVLGISASLLAFRARGQNSESAVIDSRLVDVEKACKVDEITIDDLFNERGEPNIVEHGNDKNDCKKKLVNKVYNLANAECMLYTKIEKPRGGASGSDLRAPEEACHASRGNLNPQKHFGFSNNGRTCFLAEKVTYTCN